MGGFLPTEKNCGVAWRETTVEMEGKGSTSSSIGALGGN